MRGEEGDALLEEIRGTGAGDKVGEGVVGKSDNRWGTSGTIVVDGCLVRDSLLDGPFRGEELDGGKALDLVETCEFPFFIAVDGSDFCDALQIRGRCLPRRGEVLAVSTFPSLSAPCTSRKRGE